MKDSAKLGSGEDESRRWPLCPAWVMGVLLLGPLPLPLNILALAYTPQSLIAPLFGITLVFCQLMAGWILKEPVTFVDWVSTALIVSGGALAVVSSSTLSATSSEFTHLLEVPMLGFEITLIILSAVATRAVLVADSGATKFAALAFLGGACGAHCNLGLKLVGHLIVTDTMAVQPFVVSALVIGTIGVGFCQLTSFSRGMQLYSATLFVPSYYGCLITLSTISGSVYFDEFVAYTPLGFLVFGLGCALVLAGVGVLCLKIPSSVEHLSEYTAV
eukprot:NODE_2371_length_1216_cov_35.458440_g2163_i0.p1 GENE.NODE_2371_length_1216_cov_35.458440_g2163_i0~~NODE_2371_length_1216_cov_35.458440_g2163_i0.p1  ORF type:complete len:300 (+),score=34.00 NODE_2371_length_1216_cov_35.458440_g2163_i0:79-900(+)